MKTEARTPEYHQKEAEKWRAKGNFRRAHAHASLAKKKAAKRKIADLEAHRNSVNFAYQNSGWGMGPHYRSELAQIDRELSELRRAAA